MDRLEIIRRSRQWEKDGYRLLEAVTGEDKDWLITEVDRLNTTAQGYYDQADIGWGKFREAERRITVLEGALQRILTLHPAGSGPDSKRITAIRIIANKALFPIPSSVEEQQCGCRSDWLCDEHHREALEDAYGPHGQG